MPTQNMLMNVDQPSPRWYRKSRRIVGLLSGPAFLGFVSIFRLSDYTISIIGQVIAFVPTIIEVFSAALSDGQEYAPEGTKQKLADMTGKAIVEPESGVKTTPDK